MDLVGLGRPLTYFTADSPKTSVLFEQGLKNGVAEQESTVPGEEKLPRSCQYAACFSGSVCLSSICRVHRYLASVSNAILLLGIKFCSQKIGM